MFTQHRPPIRLILASIVCVLFSALTMTHTDLTPFSPETGDEGIAVDAQHSGQTPHFEPSALEWHSPCAVCLFHERTRVRSRPSTWGPDRLKFVAIRQANDLPAYRWVLDAVPPSRGPPLS